MAKVLGPKNGVVWDQEANRPLVRFVNGVFETTDKKLLSRLKALGYGVEDSKKAEDA